MKVTEMNIQEVLVCLTEKDKDYILLNNIRIINPYTGKVGRRFRHYMEIIRDCQHENTKQSSYTQREGEEFFTVCCDCGKSWFE